MMTAKAHNSEGISHEVLDRLADEVFVCTVQRLGQVRSVPRASNFGKGSSLH